MFCRQASTEIIKRFKARRSNIGYVFLIYVNKGDLSAISSNFFSEPINEDGIQVDVTGGLKLSGWCFPDWLRRHTPLTLKSPFSSYLYPPSLFSQQFLHSSARDHKTQSPPSLLLLQWFSVKQPAEPWRINNLLFLYQAHCGLYTQKQVSEEALKLYSTRATCLLSEAFPDSCHVQFIWASNS